MTTANPIADALLYLRDRMARRRWHGRSEHEIQDAIQAALEDAPDPRFRVSREHRLGPAPLSSVPLVETATKIYSDEPIPPQRVSGVAAVLADLHKGREAGRDRIDFAIVAEVRQRPNIVGLEVKIAGGTTEVCRQIQRYAGHADVGAVMLATTSVRLVASMPPELAGKPVFGLHLRRM